MSDLIEIEMPKASSKRLIEIEVGNFFILDGVLYMLHSIEDGKHLIMRVQIGLIHACKPETLVVPVKVKIIVSNM